MMNGKKIIAVLPAYNAARTLKMTIDAIPKDIVDDIILVDDVSHDDTVAVARSTGLKIIEHPKNRGYGGNQKTCYKAAVKAGADIVVMVHPDFQYDPLFIPKLIAPIAKGECDAVFGSRMIIKKNALDGGMPYWKFLANIFLTKLENTVLRMHLSEYHSGFRAYSRNVFECLPIELNSDDFVFDTEIIVQMKIADMRIKEIPISTRYFPEASMIGIWRSTKYGISILAVMLRFLLHRFHLVYYARLGSSPSDRLCPYCESRFSRLILPGNHSLDEALKESYFITSERSGMHSDIYECLQCGLAYVLRDKKKEKKIQDYYAQSSLDTVYINDAKGRRRTADRILQTIEKVRKVRGGKILDLGCNAGLFLAEATERNYEVYGIELSVAAIQYAAETLGIDTIKHGSDEMLREFPDNFFDVITAFDVLEHVVDPKRTLDNIYAKLRPGGLLVFTAPNIKSLYARVTGNHWHALVPSHLSYFSPQFVEYVEKTSKFEIIRTRSYLRYFSLTYLLRRLVKNNALSLPIIFGYNIPINLFDEMEVYLRKKK